MHLNLNFLKKKSSLKTGLHSLNSIYFRSIDSDSASLLGNSWVCKPLQSSMMNEHQVFGSNAFNEIPGIQNPN